jgi:hypothetical protein
MSHKTEADKTKPNYPWTARQLRMKKARRLARKQSRKLLKGGYY